MHPIPKTKGEVSLSTAFHYSLHATPEGMATAYDDMGAILRNKNLSHFLRILLCRLLRNTLHSPLTFVFHKSHHLLL